MGSEMCIRDRGARANLVSSLVLLGVAIFLELIVLSVIRVRTGHGKKVVR